MNFPESDYGTGSSGNSSSASSWWSGERQASLQPSVRARPKSEHLELQSSSYLDIVSRCTREDVRLEFQQNGSDSPYCPDDDLYSSHQGELSGLGPAAQYLRQKSWPEPERSPAPRLPRPRPLSLHEPRWGLHYTTSTPLYEEAAPAPFAPEVSASEVYSQQLTAEQARALSSLPDAVLYPLLSKLRDARRNKAPQECRFCKSNGERVSFYRSHGLKDGAGRVTCPVLRAFICRRCGASGDTAHTIKYCPLSTCEERGQSARMMRSVRMASNRRRYSLTPSATDVQDYVLFGQPTPSVIDDNHALSAELDPVWAAVERKLLM